MFKVKRDQHSIKKKTPKAVFIKAGYFKLEACFFQTPKYALIFLYLKPIEKSTQLFSFDLVTRFF